MATDLIELALADIGEHFARYRLRSAAAERVLQASLRRYGQMSPVVVFPWQGRHELVDGFKRLAAARAVQWVVESVGPRDRGRRALGQGGHLRLEPRQREDLRAGRSVDCPCAGARGRVAAGGGGRPPGPA